MSGNFSVPGTDLLERFRVTNPNVSEATRQRLYDYQLYPLAGVSQLSFFQAPIGQGKTTASGATAGQPKTKWDTNMQLGGQLPSGMAYLIETIEVYVEPGSVTTADTYTAAPPGFFAATAAATVLAAVNDQAILLRSGLLELNILQKNYLTETPLSVFPSKAQVMVDGAIASNSATTAEVGFARCYSDGRPYILEPQISIQPAVNFEVVLKWPAAVTITNNARIGVILDGIMYRASQ